MNKEKIFLLIALATIAGNACANQQTLSAEDSSGKERFHSIFTNSKTGLGAYHTDKEGYAEVKNIAQDLHTDEIVDFFGCKTIAGKAFFADALAHPLNSQDKSSLVTRRQHIIRTLVENPEFKAQVEAKLELARQHEQEVLLLLSDFFKGKTCPELKQLEAYKQQGNLPSYYMLHFLTQNPTGRVIYNAAMLAATLAGIYTTSWLARMAYPLRKAGVPNIGLEIFTTYYAACTGVISYMPGLTQQLKTLI